MIFCKNSFKFFIINISNKKNKEKGIIVTKSKLGLFAARQANKSGDEVLRQGITTLFGKPGVLEDGGLGSPRKPSYRGLDASFFYRIGEEVRK